VTKKERIVAKELQMDGMGNAADRPLGWIGQKTFAASSV